MLTLTREESERDGSMEHGHGERDLGGALVMARRRRTRTVASPELGWWHRRFGEVEEMIAELWVRCSGRWCCGGSKRAWQSSVAMATALGFALAQRERHRERSRENEHE
jgi:hypothetical protein